MCSSAKRIGSPARRKRHIACDELFHFMAKLIARSLKLFLASSCDPLRCARSLVSPLRGGFVPRQGLIFFINTEYKRRT